MIRSLLIMIYVLVILGISATVRAEDIMPIFVDRPSPEVLVVKGTVAVSVDGDTYLITEEGSAFELLSNVELFDLNGQGVKIHGVELKHKVDSDSKHARVNPLQDEARVEAEPIPVLVVLKISEIGS